MAARQRLRSVLHRVLNDTKVRMDVGALKDDSRPVFQRPANSIGLYLDALDARPDRNTTVGSHHAFMMNVMDRLQEHLRDLDLCKLKGAMETRRVGNGVIFEGVKHSCIISLTFDSLADLEDFHTLHKKNRLSAVFQDMLVDRALLKFTNCVKLTLRVKLWEDEIKACKEDLRKRSDARVKLSSSDRDQGLVRRIQDYQKAKLLSDKVAKARDVENEFEHKLGEFMLTIKQILPQNTQVIKTIKEFHTNLKMARGVKRVNYSTTDNYLHSLEFFRKSFQEIEREIVFPLCQIQVVFETEKQRNLKKTIKKAASEMLGYLKPDVDLQKVRHKEWEGKVLQREHGLFYGLISLIPMSFDRLTTIDYSLDEYINDFPEIGQSLQSASSRPASNTKS